MHRDGRYAVWFKTSRGEGTAIVHLADGVISGGDSFFSYGGSYQFDDDHFTAVLKTTRHAADGPPTLFGTDEVEVELKGAFRGRMASCAGKARHAPSLSFEATLILSEEHTAGPAGSRSTKPVVGLRAWKPVARGLSRV